MPYTNIRSRILDRVFRRKIILESEKPEKKLIKSPEIKDAWRTNRGKLMRFDEHVSPQECLDFINRHRHLIPSILTSESKRHPDATEMMSDHGMFLRTYKDRTLGKKDPKTGKITRIPNQTIEGEARILMTARKALEAHKKQNPDNILQDIDVEIPIAVHLTKPGFRHNYLITKFVEGEHFRELEKTQYEALKKILIPLGIKPEDVQYIQDENGRKHIIDAEFWRDLNKE